MTKIDYWCRHEGHTNSSHTIRICLYTCTILNDFKFYTLIINWQKYIIPNICCYSITENKNGTHRYLTILIGVNSLRLNWNSRFKHKSFSKEYKTSVVIGRERQIWWRQKIAWANDMSSYMMLRQAVWIKNTSITNKYQISYQ